MSGVAFTSVSESTPRLPNDDCTMWPKTANGSPPMNAMSRPEMTSATTSAPMVVSTGNHRGVSSRRSVRGCRARWADGSRPSRGLPSHFQAAAGHEQAQGVDVGVDSIQDTPAMWPS